jgi:hypothetical protein
MLQQRPPWWKILIVGLLIVVTLVVNIYFLTCSKAEEIECWILCQPDSYVNARLNPKKKSIEIGRLECGDKIYTDGKIKNGFLHCYVGFEYGEGWVHKGYVVYDKPERPVFPDTTITSKGRVAARRTINGDRRCWLKDGQKIKVYMTSSEWSVTNKGFVKTEYIDIGR